MSSVSQRTEPADSMATRFPSPRVLDAATLGFSAAENGIGFGKLAAPLRAAIAGRSVTPSVYDMMLTIGREETIARLTDAATCAMARAWACRSSRA